MNNQISLLPPQVTIHDGKAVTTSVAIADYFHKSHDNVLKKIRSVIAECQPDYHLVNFNEVVREVPGGDGAVRKMPVFELTRDGFVLIVMGFTGKRALQWKIDYINAFNQMEAKLYEPTANESIKVTIPSEGRWLVCYQNRHHRVINIDGNDCVNGEYIRKLRHDVHLLVKTLQDFGYRTLVMSGDASPRRLDKPLIENTDQKIS